ncbi:MAG: hypothetical protein A2X28_00330 [Elusimicrobia bacterium GWA2_56_46]|nr:MAG: hypothetical protein A2X28_00330 [Elusimicrobia bacterium GWA2_56_46]OGR55814.1 MAG: hypothetical protein A2X39_05705 [Elusimicrobia bacterium GWC2_56_31]
MPDGMISDCVDLLLASDEEQVRLEWFGGEPLLRYDTIIRQSRAALLKAGKLGKKLKFVIATNGFLLTPGRVRRLAELPLEYILSIDGALPKQSYQRPFRSAPGKYPFWRLRAAIKELNRLKQEYFVNIVTLPGREGSLEDDVDYLLALGVTNFHFAYAMGVDWPLSASRAYFEKILRLRLSREKQGAGRFVLNVDSGSEPSLSCPLPSVDCDGAVYFGSVIPALEKNFPKALAATKIGELRDFSRLSQLEVDRNTALRRVAGAYPAGSRKGRIINSNLRMGALSRGLFAEISGFRRPASRG